MAKIGDEVTYDGVTYVLVDSTLMQQLNPNPNEMLCPYCALDELDYYCHASDCYEGEGVGGNGVYVRKLGEVKDEPC